MLVLKALVYVNNKGPKANTIILEKGALLVFVKAAKSDYNCGAKKCPFCEQLLLRIIGLPFVGSPVDTL